MRWKSSNLFNSTHIRLNSLRRTALEFSGKELFIDKDDRFPFIWKIFLKKSRDEVSLLRQRENTGLSK